MRETKIEDFFVDKLPLIRGKWDWFYEDKTLRKLFLNLKSRFKKLNVQKNGYKLAQQKSAKLLGFKKYLRRDHTPVSVRKSTIEEYFRSNPDFLDNNIKHRFRDSSQFLMASLSNHLEIKNKTYVIDNNFNLSYYQSYNYFKTVFKLFWFDYSNSKKFMCFQSLELANKKTLGYILIWIDKKLNTNFSESIS